jgi:ribulose-phosphate 3-epimerase
MVRTLPATGTIEIAPSILSADFSRLGAHIAQVSGEVRILHLDIMDGHFVPNLTIGPVVVKSLRKCSELFYDTHLMIADPLKYAGEFVKAGSDGITFHLEAVSDPWAAVRELRKLKTAVGVSIKPKTPVEALAGIIGEVDMVLLMTVEPGFGGQSFLPESPERCRELKGMLRPDQRLEVDGGIDARTAPVIVAAGADTLVAGNAVFGAADPGAAVRAIREAVKPTANSKK